MPAVNTKEIKYGIKAENYPDKILKDLQKVVQDVVKSHREIPKSVSDWKKELQFIKNDADTINNKLRTQRDLVKSLTAAYKQASDSERTNLNAQMHAAETRLQNLTRQHQRVRQVMGSVNTHMGVQSGGHGGGKHGGSPFVNHIMEEFAKDGIPGAVGGLLRSGAGKLGMAGLAAYGVKKTYDWLQEKSEESRKYNIESQRLNYRYGLNKDLASYTDMTSPGEGGLHTNNQMMEMYGALGRSTGSVFLNRPDMMAGFSGYSRHQGLSFDETAGILGHGVKSGMIKPGSPEEASGVLNMFANTMSSGVKLGFDKSERISQLVKLTGMANKDFLSVNKDSTNKIVAELRMLERLNIRGLTGDKAIEAISMTRNMFAPNSKSTGMFAHWWNLDGAINTNTKNEIDAGAKARGGASWAGMTPMQQMGLRQETLQAQAKSMPVFKGLLDYYRKQSGGEGILASIMGFDSNPGKWADLTGATDKLDSKSYNKAYGEITGTAHADKAAANELAHKAEVSEYLKGQTDLTQSNIALRSVIDAELQLRKLELSVSSNASTYLSGRMKEMSIEELKSYASSPGIPEAMRKQLGDEVVRREAMADPNSKSAYRMYAGNAAAKYGIDPALISSMVANESGWNQGARSNKGAIGLMQLMPKTAAGLGVDPTNPEQNIEGGTKYMRQLLNKYKGNERAAVAAYNMGPGALDKVIDKRGGFENIKPGDLPKETEAYLGKVFMAMAKMYEGQQSKLDVVFHGAPPGTTVHTTSSGAAPKVSGVQSTKGSAH
jgi:soluble lytic murein transglycosylase-like protein